MDYYSYTWIVLAALIGAASGFVVAYRLVARRSQFWTWRLSETHRQELAEIESIWKEKFAKLATDFRAAQESWTEARSAADVQLKAMEAKLLASQKDADRLRAAEKAARDAADQIRSATAGIRAEYEIQIAGLKAEAAEWRCEADNWQAKAGDWQSKAAEWKAMSELATDLVSDSAPVAVATLDPVPASLEEIEDYKRTIAAWENHVQALSAEYEAKRYDEERWRKSMETELNALRANLSDRNDHIAKLEADAALLSHLRQSMRARQTRIDGLELQVRQLREELAAVRANLTERNNMVAKLEADAALLSHVRQSMRERQTQIDGLKLQLQAARAAAAHPSSGQVEAEIEKLQLRIRDLEAEKAGEDRLHSLQLRLRVATLKGIRFLPDSAEIIPESVAAIDNAAVALSAVKGVKVEIAGHTDSVGDEGENVRLSQLRAEVVRDYLISRGVRAEMLTAVGYGGSRPIADNTLDDGRFANRRIDFVVR
ncbi:hypothetical protein F183_A36120 [Bryobacterales bacterium F-183]|nr:hypothetical protein F183_A36120 [Bryobacterales bacterium F-183]